MLQNLRFASRMLRKKPRLYTCRCLLTSDRNWRELRNVQLGRRAPVETLTGFETQRDCHDSFKLAIRSLEQRVVPRLR